MIGKAIHKPTNKEVIVLKYSTGFYFVKAKKWKYPHWISSSDIEFK